MTDPNRAWLDGLEPGDTAALRSGRFEAVAALLQARRAPGEGG